MTNDLQLNIEYLPVDQLTPYQNNARKHQREDVGAIVESIKEFGFDDPIGVWGGHNVIVEGHGRLMAAKKLGMKAVPVIHLDHLTDEQRRAYALAHNRTAELSEWDEVVKELELSSISEIDMSRFGFDPFKKDEDEIAEDTPPLPPEEPKSKPGDIYQLGRHRLMCGDSTDPDEVDKLLGGVTVDLFLTDPPYNVNLGSIPTPTESNIVPILNDSMPEQEFIHFLASALWNAERNMRPGAALYIFYVGLHHMEFEGAFRQILPFKLHEQLVWVKSAFVLGRNSDYQWQHECCLYGWKTGAAHYFTNSRQEGTVIEDRSMKLSTMKKGELIQLCEKLLGLDEPGTVLRADKPTIADLHPTVKPQALLVPLIRNSSKKGWNVLDLFGGSGSTLIACEQTGRTCYMMELDPHYVDVIIARWEEFTGQKAELLNGL